MASCLRKTRTVLSVVKALVCRGMFVLHSLMCIWRVTVIKSSVLYWSLAGSLPLIIMETIYTVCKKKHGEWKWICPSVLLYLATSVPAIWFLELDVMTRRGQVSGMRHENISGGLLMANDTETMDLLNGKFKLDISLGSEEWCKVLEQILLLVLIVGRWLLPKGEITREQLSQLLLVYIGMAADIIELFEAFKEDKVRENKLLNLTILSLWTASLTQFTLVLTATKSKQRRTSCIRDGEDRGAASCSNGVRGCCPAEVLSILLSVFLQDAPFLVLRMLLIFRYDVLSYSNIFFTSKNSLVLMLQIYRLVVLFTDSPEPTTSKSKQRQRPNAVTSGSSSSNSLSLASDFDGSILDGSDLVGNSSDEDDWNKSLRFKPQRGHLRRRATEEHCKSDSITSLDTDLDSIPGTNLMDRNAVLVMVPSKRAKGKGKHSRKSPGGLWVCRYQKRPYRRERSNVDRGKDDKKGPGSDYPSPVLPSPLEPLNTNHDSAGGRGTSTSYNNNASNNSNNNNVIGKGKGRIDDKSPKASPSRSYRSSSKDSSNKHLHDNHRHQGDNYAIPTTWHNQHNDENEDDEGDRKSYSGSRSSSRRHHWSSIRGLQAVLTLLEEKGNKYRTVVLKHTGDGTPVYVIDGNTHNRHDISV